MNLMSSLREQLIRDEGLRLRAYQDSRGIWTIGFGRNLQVLEITQALAEVWLDEDLAHVERLVAVRMPWTVKLDEPRLAVIMNMAFNVGIFGLLKFRRFLQAVELEDWKQAAAEMRASLWATQVGPRAERLAQQMTSGEWT